MRKRLLLILSLLVCILIASCHKSNKLVKSEVDVLLSEADSLFNETKVYEALSKQTKAYQAAKNVGEKACVQVNMSQCHYFVGEVVIARNLLEQALAVLDTVSNTSQGMLIDHKLEGQMLYAEVLKSLGFDKKAERQYMIASRTALESDHREEYVECRLEVLSLISHSNNYGSAIDGYRDLLNYCHGPQFATSRFNIYQHLHSLFLSIGNTMEADAYLSAMKQMTSETDLFNNHIINVSEMRQRALANDLDGMANCVGRLRKDVLDPSLAGYYEFYAMGLLGEYYLQREQYDSAAYYIKRYCAMTADDTRPMIVALSSLLKAQIMIFENKFDSARVILNDKELKQICNYAVDLNQRYYNTLSNYYYHTGNYRESYANMRRMSILMDSSRNELLSHNIAYRNMAHQRDTTIITNSIKIRQQQNELDSLTFWRRVWICITIATIAGSLIVALNYALSMVREREKEICQQNMHLQHEVVRHTSILQTQKVELERTNSKLNREIEYASRIQNDILPSEARMDSPMLLGHSLNYMPCNHISGDFYWFYNIGNKRFICCADATGHGIPGAFVAMVCSTILNDIAALSPSSSANLMTDLDANMRNILMNNGTTHGNDSVDMSMVCLDEATNKCSISLSRHHAYIVRTDGTVEILEGVKRSIGDLDEAFIAREFKNIELQMNEGDMLYLTTDGFESQFGGPKGQKLKRKRMITILKEAASFPINKRKNFINQHFVDWKGNNEQTDDVLIIGLCFKRTGESKVDGIQKNII